MNKKIVKIWISIILSTLIIIGLVWTSKTNLFLINTSLLWGLAWIYLFCCCYFILLGWCRDNCKKYNINPVKICLLTFVLSVIALFAFPYKYGKVLTNNYIEKMRCENTTIILCPLNDQGGEIKIESIKVDNKPFNVYQILLDDKNWYFKDGKIYNDGNNTAPLVLSFGKGTLFDIKFATSEMAGIVKIAAGDYEYLLDLNSNENSELNLNWERLYGNVTSAPILERILYYFLCLVLIWLFVYFLTILIYKINNSKRS